MLNEEKQKALEAALGQIEKQYGKGSIMKLGEQEANMQVEAIPTGSLALILLLVSAVFQKDVLLKSTDRNQAVRPQLPYIW